MTTLTIRKAISADLPRIQDIYATARAFMAQNDNPHQWGDSGYPSPTLLAEDVTKGQLYVIEADGEIEGVFMHAMGPDPTYAVIDGAWPDDLPYAVIHRIASLGRVKGILRAAVDFATSRCPTVRMDTHADNTVMQNALSRLGFVYCGIIHLENGSPRLAYQKTGGPSC